jgi:hypothetical protein
MINIKGRTQATTFLNCIIIVTNMLSKSEYPLLSMNMFGIYYRNFANMACHTTTLRPSILKADVPCIKYLSAVWTLGHDAMTAALMCSRICSNGRGNVMSLISCDAKLQAITCERQSTIAAFGSSQFLPCGSSHVCRFGLHSYSTVAGMVATVTRDSAPEAPARASAGASHQDKISQVMIWVLWSDDLGTL